MKRTLIFILVLFVCTRIFSQELTAVVVPFDVKVGFSRADAETITELFLIELAKNKTIKVVDQSDAAFKEIINRMKFELSDWSNNNKVAQFGQALNADAIVLGQMMMLGDQRIITARILDVKTTQILATSRMDLINVSEVLGKLPAFTREIVSNLPKPPIGDPFTGRWRSTITSNGITLICILDFRRDGTINVERYDTNRVIRGLAGMSHSNETKRGRGYGTYSFRESGNSVIADISLTLSGVLIEFTAVTARVIFYQSSPNQFTVDSEYMEDSMKCEYYDGGRNNRYINDTYKIFNKM
jgi:TolB-like protein